MGEAAVEDLLRREGTQAGQTARGAAHRRGPAGAKGKRFLRAIEEGLGVTAARLHDGAMEEAAGGGGDEVPADTKAASALAKDGHRPWVATKAGNVGGHPGEGSGLVQGAGVASAVVGLEGEGC